MYEKNREFQLFAPGSANFLFEISMASSVCPLKLHQELLACTAGGSKRKDILSSMCGRLRLQAAHGGSNTVRPGVRLQMVHGRCAARASTTLPGRFCARSLRSLENCLECRSQAPWQQCVQCDGTWVASNYSWSKTSGSTHR